MTTTAKRVKAFQAGELNHRLIWQREVESVDGAGGYTVQWSSLGAIWVDIRPIAAGEAVFAGTTGQSTTHKLTMRRHRDFRAGDRFVKGARHFVVVAVFDPDETGRYCQCEVREESA